MAGNGRAERARARTSNHQVNKSRMAVACCYERRLRPESAAENLWYRMGWPPWGGNRARAGIDRNPASYRQTRGGTIGFARVCRLLRLSRFGDRYLLQPLQPDFGFISDNCRVAGVAEMEEEVLNSGGLGFCESGKDAGDEPDVLLG